MMKGPRARWVQALRRTIPGLAVLMLACGQPPSPEASEVGAARSGRAAAAPETARPAIPPTETAPTPRTPTTATRSGRREDGQQTAAGTLSAAAASDLPEEPAPRWAALAGMNLGYAQVCGAGDAELRGYRARVEREKAALASRGFDVDGFDATFEAAAVRQRGQWQGRHPAGASPADCAAVLAHIGARPPAD